MFSGFVLLVYCTSLAVEQVKTSSFIRTLRRMWRAAMDAKVQGEEFLPVQNSQIK